MKRINLLITFLIIFGITSYSQIAYQDAIILRKCIANSKFDNGKRAFIDSVLSHYLLDQDATITSEFGDNNPFFKDLFPDRTPHNGVRGLKSIISSVGNLDVTNIADGLARFLIKRGKEELNIAFFQKLKDFLEDENNPEARTLFPASATFLKNITAYQYAELLQSLREAFYKDISNLVVNLNLLIDLPKYQELLKALPEIRVAIRSAKIISELSQADSSMHPANLISHFATLKEWGEMNINLESSWKVLDAISQSIRTLPYTTTVHFDTISTATIRESLRINPGGAITDTTKIDNGYYSIKRRVAAASETLVKFDTIITKTPVQKIDTIENKEIAWIKFSEFHEHILNDTVTLKIYLGLLYQRMEGINFRYAGSDISVQQFMKDNKDNISRIADLVENFLVLANDVEQSIKEIKNKKEAGLTKDDYYTYIQKAIDVIDYGFKVANTIKEGIADDRYIVMARNGNNLYKNIYTKNYNAAIMNGYLIFKEIFKNSKDALQDKNDFLATLKDPNSSLSQRMPSAERILILKDTLSFEAASSALNRISFNSDRNINKRSDLVEKILNYGNMMASIVKAESSEEAEAAIEAAALPAGSSSIKKNTAFNISLNAYLGGYFGRRGNNSDEIDGNSSNVGVTAPVGIAFNLGLGHYPNGSPIGAISLLGTLIDVGAIAGYRLNNDSSALDQKITLNDIFTPGGYLVYGIGLPFKGFSYIPLSVGYGWQYGSKLYYKKNDGKLAISDKSRWRNNWFIAIDIPLANILTINYKRKNKN